MHRFRLLLIFAVVLATASVSTAQSPYRLEGKVFERDALTGIEKPVAGAVIQMFDVTVLDGPGRIKWATSDARGHYSLEVPLGHNAPGALIPPPGYLPAVKSPVYEPFAVTDEAPVFVKNHEVVRGGASVRVELRGARLDSAPGQRFVVFMQQGKENYTSFSCELEADGSGFAAAEKLSGKFEVSCVQSAGIRNLTGPASVEFDEGFDPDQVVETGRKTEAGAIRAKDAAGKSATFVGCEPVVKDKKLTIALDGLDLEKIPLRRLTGRVVDDAGKGIDGARVELRVVNAAGTKAEIFQAARSDKSGNFSILSPQGDGQKATLLINMAGYAPLDVLSMPIPDSGANEADLGAITLKTGCSVRVRVVGKDGLPLPGAVVAVRGGMAMMAIEKRTDKKGECTLTELPVGEVIRADVLFGDVLEICKLPALQREGNEPLTLKATNRKFRESGPARKKPPLVVGQTAPEWNIAEWTDGKARKLSDYRGKLVLLEFWGVWCGPCRDSIPALKELEAKYGDKGVEFISIHTAGTDMSLLRRHLESFDWRCAAGLDLGESVDKGETTDAYHIHGYPTMLLIGANGKIIFTTDLAADSREGVKILKDYEEIAKSLDLPWPLDKGLDTADLEKYNAEMKARANKLAVAFMSKQIEAALKEGGQ